jgi:broad specificity phosphatase PhoE
VTIFLVRHARAGNRSSWTGEDWLRPLSRRGQAQAEGFLEVFAEEHVDRILSSPYVRCMESMVQLAGQRMVAVEPTDALAEGASLESALTLVRKHTHHNAVFCSHGDVIPMLLEYYAARGVDLGPKPSCPKGCTWILDVDGTGDVVAARYVPPT